MSLWLFLLAACVVDLTRPELMTFCQPFQTRNECVDTYGTPLGPPVIAGSKVACAIKCTQHNQCISFIYRTLQCRLNANKDECPQPDCGDGLFYGEVGNGVTNGPMPMATNCVNSPADPRIRLCNGSGAHEGRLEVYHEARWGTVCDDRISYQASWDSRNADVVCRMFGYQNGTPLLGAFFGEGEGCIWMDEIQCAGTEASVFNCTRNPWAVHDCYHHEDVGVTCF